MLSTKKLAARTPFYYGWVVAGAVSTSMMLTGLFAAPTFSIFIEPWTAQFGWSRTAISGAFSAATVAAALVGPAVGRALDRYGGRLILGIGGLLMAASLAGMAMVQQLLALYVVLSVGRSAMMSVQNLASHTVVANWFIRRRALATAVIINGNRIGLGGWPVIAATILAVHGWRSALWVMAAACALLALVPVALIVARRPEEAGLLPDGAASPAKVLTVHRLPPQATEYPWKPKEAFRTRAFWMLTMANMALMVAGGGFGVHRIPYFVGKGMSDGLIGPVLLVYAASMSGGGFLAAWATARFSQRKVMAAFILAASSVMLIALAVPPNAAVLGFEVLEGVSFGGGFAILPVSFADYFGRASIGTIRGLTHPAVVTANALGPIIGGVVYDTQGGNYAWAFVTYGIVTACGAVAAWLARPPASPESRLPAD